MPYTVLCVLLQYCESLKYGGKGPNAIMAAGLQWGPDYQTQIHPPGCPTVSWQPAYGVNGGAPLVSRNGTSSADGPVLGFCQSSQPKWSAYRDPRLVYIGSVRGVWTACKGLLQSVGLVGEFIIQCYHPGADGQVDKADL